VHGPVDVRLVLERLIPGGVRPVGGRPRTAGDRLMICTATFRSRQMAWTSSKLRRLALVLGHEEVVGEQHRVEVEAGEAPPVHGRDGPAVAGDADEARQTLLAGLDRRLEDAALAMA